MGTLMELSGTKQARGKFVSLDQRSRGRPPRWVIVGPAGWMEEALHGDGPHHLHWPGLGHTVWGTGQHQQLGCLGMKTFT